MNKIIDEFILKALKEDKFIEILDNFEKLQTNQERVKFILNIMLKYESVPNTHDMPKNADKSNKFRLKGNIFYKTGVNNITCNDILKLYTQSIAFAPYPSVELALGYANRSAVLLKLGLYSECIEDIDRALTLNYPDDLKAKIYKRKAECLMKKNDVEVKATLQKAYYWLDKTFSNKPEEKKLQAKLISSLKALDNVQTEQSVIDSLTCTEVETLESELSTIAFYNNTEVTCASDAITIEYSKDYGRYIVATRDIQSGEVIAVEKPYALLLEQDKIYTHCSNCLEICWANIPCKRCTCAMYCSKKCRQDAWKKCHNVECDVFPALIGCGGNNSHLLSVRLAVFALREAEDDMNKLRDMIKKFDNCKDPRTSNFFQDGRLHSDKYVSMYNYMTSASKKEDNIYEQVTSSFAACTILYFLATRSEIFGAKLSENLSELMKNNDVTFLGGLILKHQWIIPSNMRDFTEAQGSKSMIRGRALMSFCSLMKHSCNQNILRQSRSKHVVMYAIRPIQAGRQLFDGYGPYFAEKTKENRQKELKEYFFDCKCVACKLDWGLSDDLSSYMQQNLVKELKEETNNKLKEAMQNLFTYRDLINKGNVDDKHDLIVELLKIIEILHKYTLTPCREMATVIIMLKRANALTGNRFKLPQVKY